MAEEKVTLKSTIEKANKAKKKGSNFSGSGSSSRVQPKREMNAWDHIYRAFNPGAGSAGLLGLLGGAKLGQREGNNPKRPSEGYSGSIVKRPALPKAVGSLNKAAPVDPMEELLAQLGQGYSGTMPGFDDTEARAALQSALDATLSGINGLRGQTRSNFAESDQNLQSMHRAYENDIRTNVAQQYNGIADEQANNIRSNQQFAQNELAQIDNDSRAKREAMLRNLGIESSAAAPESTEIQNAQANITKSSAADMELANAQKANYANYNQGVASSVGAAGLERRSALERQLNDILGQLDLKESDARAQNQNSLAQLAAQKAGNQNNLASFEYGMYQDEQNGIRDIFNRMMESQSQEAEIPQISGYAGLAQDLVNSGIDQGMASQVMRAHANIVGSDAYIKAVQRGQDPTAFAVRELTKQGIPSTVAIQWVTNYGNLGKTSKYSPMM